MDNLDSFLFYIILQLYFCLKRFITDKNTVSFLNIIYPSLVIAFTATCFVVHADITSRNALKNIHRNFHMPIHS